MNISDTLKKFYGYDDFRPLQEEIIENIITGNDAFVLMPTGGGKSICYQIPALHRKGIAIIISPLIALMKDQVMALRQNGIPSAFINSSLHHSEINNIVSQCIEGKIKLLYLSPETLIVQKENLLNQLDISLFAIDEAHCISAWGHDFRKEYTQLGFLKIKYPHIPIIALTATADKVTRNDILKQLNIENAKQFIASFDRPNLHLKVVKAAPEQAKIDKIIELYHKYPNSSGIIYCLSRKSTEKIALKLQEKGISCKAYHAGLDSFERTKVQDEFSGDKIKLVIATIAFGMGIDKSDVRYIVHFNLPKTIESYYQEIGRAGRDGHAAETILYYNLADLIILRKFAEESEQSEYNIEKLRFMQQYCEASHCRRKILINYFNEAMSHDCNYCDVCENPPKFIDGTVLAQKVLSAIVRSGQQEASTMIINILRGSNNKELIQKNYDRIKTFGAGRDLSYEIWQAYILQFIQLGVIEPAYDENFALKVGNFGNEILQGKREIQLTTPEIYSTKKKKNTVEKKELPEKDVRSPFEYNKILYEALSDKRKEIAANLKLPAFIVFTNNSLKEMCEKMPQDEQEFLSISGVSHNKFLQYGQEFIEIINAFAQSNPQKKQIKEVRINSTKTPKNIELSDEFLGQVLNEMRSNKMPLSHVLATKILLDHHTIQSDPNLRSLSFHGSMKENYKYNELLKLVKQFYTKHIYSNLDEEVQQYFSKEKFNHISESRWASIQNQIDQIPIEENQAEYIKEFRLKHKRSHCPWTQDELDIFKEIIESCNDLPLISQVLGRSEGSIIAAYKNELKLKFLANQTD